MRKLNCAIVEDSNVQRTLLEQIIHKTPNLELLYSFTSSTEALEKINSSKIDLLFLDIEMPFMNGFEFIAGLQIKPQVIITSQNSNYALEAFDHNVIDFLLKPYSKKRFEIAVGKAIIKVKTSIRNKPESKLVIKHNLKQVELNIHAIQWVEALGDYVKVITPERNYVILSTLSTFHKKLGDDKFVRIHKSYIVNLKMVERYNHEFIEIKDKKIPISRTKGIELDRLLKCVE
ncbi:LytTR family DNA-binding domain-containing protein [uncultured Maribacter sp.]|uniref:LytR/AlgR family response regulator transcription factor n=1 Tax=uncultured Maribacter sp. TaxID=431308 RepID=UPI0030EE434E|tara:strand:- start:6950 stop:7645 length:696 start_codon:yes stop_codon:yes gene_type:complete